MWDDILEIVLLIFDDIIGFFWRGWKDRKERKNVRKKRMKDNVKQTEKDPCEGLFSC